MVLAAGVAQAEITWSGSATAGMARDGKVKATAAAKMTDTTIKAEANRDGISAAAVNAVTGISGKSVDASDADSVAAARKALDDHEKTLGTSTNDVATAKEIATARAVLDAVAGTAAKATGKMKQYSEVNAAASASVATDMGWTITMGASLDVGDGYDMADDDTFDGRTAGSVSLDTISIDFGAGGVLSLNDNGFAHLVDADDDAAADLKYTNTFGTASVSIVADIDDGDSDHKVTAASFTHGALTAADYTVHFDNTNDDTGYKAASAAADVQWSAKVSMPLAGTNVYFAADEEGGDAYGVSGTYAGLGWSVDSKREAAEKDASKDRSNTIGVTYAAGALTMGATYNSIKDGDQWGVSAAYAAGALTMNLSTDEGSDWSASGAYDLGNGASLVGGTNYTEDAYVGVSFAF